MKSITKRILGIVMTSAILVSGALSCSAICETRWLYQYKYDTLNYRIVKQYDYHYINVKYPEGYNVLEGATNTQLLNRSWSWDGNHQTFQVTRNYVIEA